MKQADKVVIEKMIGYCDDIISAMDRFGAAKESYDKDKVYPFKTRIRRQSRFHGAAACFRYAGKNGCVPTHVSSESLPAFSRRLSVGTISHLQSRSQKSMSATSRR